MTKVQNEIKKKIAGKRLLLLGGSLWKEAIKKIASEYEITLVAVSYTHLDVYKRQGYGRTGQDSGSCHEFN